MGFYSLERKNVQTHQYTMNSLTCMGFNIPPRVVSDCAVRDLLLGLHRHTGVYLGLSQASVLLLKCSYLEDTLLHQLEKPYSPLISQLHCNFCGSLFSLPQVETLSPLLCTPIGFSTY